MRRGKAFGAWRYVNVRLTRHRQAYLLQLETNVLGEWNMWSLEWISLRRPAVQGR